MDQIFNFDEKSIHITTFYKMFKALNKRQPSAVTACAICTTSLISIVFNKKPENQFFKSKVFILLTKF